MSHITGWHNVYYQTINKCRLHCDLFTLFLLDTNSILNFNVAKEKRKRSSEVSNILIVVLVDFTAISRKLIGIKVLFSICQLIPYCSNHSYILQVYTVANSYKNVEQGRDVFIRI